MLRGVVTAAPAVGPELLRVIEVFETQYPQCTVEIVELPVRDRHGPLRRGEVDLMVTRLPLDQPDLVVGPVLAREPRVLAVARDHPLARADRSPSRTSLTTRCRTSPT